MRTRFLSTQEKNAVEQRQEGCFYIKIFDNHITVLNDLLPTMPLFFSQAEHINHLAQHSRLSACVPAQAGNPKKSSADLRRLLKEKR
jgi:hypothetical protein